MINLGTVKWFDTKKGFGFIERKAGEDVFVHFTSIEDSGYRKLSEGQQVLYQVKRGKNGLMAQNVRPL